MGITRNSEHRLFFLPSFPPCSSLPMQENATTVENERSRVVAMYPECQQPPLSPVYHQNPHQQPNHRQGFNQSELAVPSNYFLPYHDSSYGYGLDTYGVTNVGTAVAMSLASLGTNLEGSTGREGEQQMFEMANGTLSQPTQLEPAQGENYLLNELNVFMNDAQEMSLMSNANSQTTGYRMQSFQVPQQPMETYSNSVYGNINPNHKEWEKLLPKPYHSENLQEETVVYSAEDGKIDRIGVPSPHRHVHKKHTWYGKWRTNVDLSAETIHGNSEYSSGENMGGTHYQAVGSPASCTSSGTMYGESLEDRISRDERKAQEMGIPLSTNEIIGLPIDEFNEKLSKYELMESQISLIRDIRRRGKNKVAAQNCRKRKLDQISKLQEEVQASQIKKSQLEMEQEQILRALRFIEDKYKQLVQIVYVSSKCYQQNSENG